MHAPLKKKRFTKDDLPKHFALSKYEQCAEWELQDWYSALSKRLKLQSNWRYANIRESRFGLLPSVISNLKEQASKVFDDPVNFAQPEAHLPRSGLGLRDQSVYEWLTGEDISGDPKYEQMAQSYRDVTTLEFDIKHLREMNPEFFEYIQVETERIHRTPAWEFRTNVEGEAPEEFFIAVSMSTPDNVLRTEFADWLKGVRKKIDERKSVGKFKSADCKEWHLQRLLPYIDLSFWASTQWAEFTQVALGNALFPNDRNAQEDKRTPEEIIGNTTAPNAEKILSRAFVSAISLQLNEKK